MPKTDKRRVMDKKSKPDDTAQSQRFIDAARKVEADETEQGADRAFKNIVSPKPQSPNKGKL